MNLENTDLQIGDYVIVTIRENQMRSEIDISAVLLDIQKFGEDIDNLPDFNLIKYKVITEDGEEITCWHSDIKLDIKKERDFTIKDILKDK